MAKTATKTRGKATGLSLHIGLNGVSGAAYGGWDGPLAACEFDANDMAALAKKQGMKPTPAADQEGDARRDAGRRCASAAKTLAGGDFFFLTYSGHGGQVPDVNGDEDDKKDETWCLYDGQLIDDELYFELGQFKAGVRILVLSDSCHSGTVTREAILPPATIPTPAAEDHARRGGDAHLPRAPGVLRQAAEGRRRGGRQAGRRSRQRARPGRGERAPLGDRRKFDPALILISGCQDNQTSMDGEHNGAFTEQLLKVWNQGGFKGNYAQLPRAHQGAHAGDAVAEPVHARQRRARSWRKNPSASDAAARAVARVSRGASMASGTSDITFIVPGQAQPAPAARSADARQRQGVGARRHAARRRRAGARHGAAGRGRRRPQRRQRADAGAASGRCARPDARAERRDDAQRAGDARRRRGDEVVVPAQLGWPGLEAEATRGSTRGWMGQAVLSGFQVLTGIAKDPAAKLAAAALTKKVDGKVEAGVYRLSADALEPLKGSGRKLDAVPAAADGGPLLVFVHGTFSDTVGTFSKLWTLHNATVRQLFASYGDRVYGLDHPTLGVSPIANALTLVRAPAGRRARASRQPTRAAASSPRCWRAPAAAAPLGNDVLALFAGDDYAEHRSDLRALVKEAQAKGIRIERVVRVACPARGTLLASKRLDAYLSILNWCLELASIPVVPEVVDFLHEVARRRAEPAELPGLEAMTPDSPVVAWLNGAVDTIPGELRVIAGDMEGDSIGSWVKTLLSDAFYWTDNDLVVQTRSMYGGAPRAKTASGSGARFLLDKGGKVSHFNYFSQRAHGAGDRERAARRRAGRLRRDRPALVGRRGRERHARRTRGRALARRGGRRSGGRGRAAGGVRHPRHPRLEPEEGRQAHLARLSLRQRPEAARLGSGDGGERRARRADRQRLRRSHRAPRRHATR